MVFLKNKLKGAFRLDAKQREAKVANLREWSITSLAKVANLRESSRVVDYVTREGCQPSRVFASGC